MTTSVASLTERVIRRWPTDRAREWVHDFLDDVASNANIVAVVAVGSAVRENVESEDLDLIVISRQEVREPFKAPIEVDVRVFSVRDLKKGLVNGDDLVTWAVKFGESLYDPSGCWREITDEWRTRLPLPNPAVARERAKTALSYLKEMQAVGDTGAALDLRVSYLTHLARAELSEAGIYPASRPELPTQLESIGADKLATALSSALRERKKG